MRPFILFILALPALPRDMDVAVAAGSPLDWHTHHSRPVPTGHRGRTPVATEYGRKPDDRREPGKTQAADRYPKGPVKAPFRQTIDYTVLNAADFFSGTSADCYSHLKWGTPPNTKPEVTQDDVATEGGYVMRWNYPPNFPAELIWVGLRAVLQEKIHPTAISWAEAAAWCLEVGEPALEGTAIGDGKIKTYFKGAATKLPKNPPDLPKHKDPKIALFYKLAAVEISGGFPYALDPTFARRTLALGDEMYDAVLECCRSKHEFLARNAVVILAGFEKATPDLVKLWKESRDPTFRARALRALAERREKSIVNDVESELAVGDLPRTVMAIYALGLIGDPASGDAVLNLLWKTKKKDTIDWAREDLLWTAIPALGRMRAGKETLIAMEGYLRKRFGGRDDTNRDDPEPLKIFRQMCLIALCHHGEKAYVDEVVRRVQKGGLDAFHKITHYALADALATSIEGADVLKTAGSSPDVHVRLAVLRALAHNQRLNAEFLKTVAQRSGELPAVRARAIQLLLDHDGPTAREVCQKILNDFVKSDATIDSGTALLVAIAAQVGGIVDAVDAPVLIEAVKRAFSQGCFARRSGNNDTNLSQTKIFLYPALFETLLIELGRTTAAEAFPVLKDIYMKRRFPQGRAEAVTAIGAIPGKESDELLLDALGDKDGWVRYCAYRALLKRSGEDHFAGWIWVDDESLARKCVAAYKAWIAKKYPK